MTARLRSSQSAYVAILATLFLVVLWFGTLDYRRLANPDEGRYAEIAREMSITGDWVTPRLNDLKYFEKPVLQYWATAAAFQTWGESEWVARLWPALTGALAILAMFIATQRVWGRTTAIASALILASSLWFMAGAHVLTVDMGVTAFMSLTLSAFLLAQHDQTSPIHRRRWMWLAWASMGLAVLSKGLIGVVLPGAVLVLYILWQRDWKRLWQLEITVGLLLFLVITLPWFIAVSVKNPEFAQFFFIHEHFQRYSTDISHRVQPWWYFIPQLLVGTLPWVSLLPGALRMASVCTPGHFQPQRLLLLWAGFIFIFFSASGSKLPLYILPVFPALAPLLALYALQLRPKTLIRHLLFAAATGLAIAIAGWALSQGWPSKSVSFAMQDFGIWIAVGGLIIALTLIIAAALVRRGRTLTAFYMAALSTLIGAQIIALGHNTTAQVNSSFALAQLIQSKLRPETELYTMMHYDQGLPFYLKRTLPMIEYQDEFALGLQQEPHRNSIPRSTLVARWQAGHPILVVTIEDGRQALERAGLPVAVLYQDKTRTLIASPSAQP